MKNFKLSSIVCILMMLGIVFVSCNKPSVIGLAVQPSSDKFHVGYTDTVSLITYCIYTDSVRSSNPTVNLLGSYVDPVFGKVSASFYAVADLLKFNNDVGTSPIADSMILSMAYAGYYGDTTTQQTIKVYQLTDVLSKDSVYYSTRNFGYATDSIGAMSFTPRPKDSVTVDTLKQPAQIRIPLSLTLANSILNSGTATLASNAAFTAFFKGIYVKPSAVTTNGQGAILYLNWLSPYSGITIYFHNSTASKLSLNMIFDGGSAVFNHFEHDYTGTAIAQQVASHSMGLVTTYAQCMSGAKTFIDFPYIKYLIDSGKVAINKAELVVTVSDNTNALYPVPATMILYALDSVGTEISLPDYTLSTFQVPITNGSEYHFILNDYIQNVILGKTKDYGLHLVCSQGAALADRVIIGGANNPTSPMKLQITYTKL